MTEFREDLEYWTDALIDTQNDLDFVVAKINMNPKDIKSGDLRFLVGATSRMKAQLHWLDQTVNHYPKPTKKFWQFWKK